MIDELEKCLACGDKTVIEELMLLRIKRIKQCADKINEMIRSK